MTAKKTAEMKPTTTDHARKGLRQLTVYQQVKEIVAQGRLVPEHGFFFEQSSNRAIEDQGISPWSEPFVLVGEELRPTSENHFGWALIRDDEGTLWFIIQKRDKPRPFNVICPTETFSSCQTFYEFLFELNVRLVKVRGLSFRAAEGAQLLKAFSAVLSSLQPFEEDD